jgi:all-trans-8'-apo-beta-carotenal 15,15'-oxygenase
VIPNGGGVMKPDDANVANTNLLHVGDEVWALWEGGSALRMDAATLATKGFVTLDPDLVGAPFSAHPRTGEDGRVWNIGSLGDRMAIYRLKPDGTLDAFKVHQIAPVGLIHDFLLTERSVVVVLPSTRIEGGSSPIFQRVRGTPANPMQVLVFDRETLLPLRQAELPSGYVFHFGNAWEDAAGTIRFDMVATRDTDHLQAMRRPMRGESLGNDQDGNVAMRVTYPVKGAPTQERLLSGVEFPRINPRFSARRNRFVYVGGINRRSAGTHWLNAVTRIDLERGRNVTFRYGDDWLVEEHVFVPRPGGTAEDDGWLIGTALHWKRRQTALSLFDARRLGDGPIARAWLDVAMPLGFHGQFRPA